MWYVLAEANAISNAELVPGTSLRVPSVRVSANDANTFKPYNPGEIIGSTAPGLPYIEKPKEAGCNPIAMIIMIVITVVVTVFTYGALTTAMSGFWASVGAGFVAGAAGSIAGQVVGKAMGVVDHFSLKKVFVDGVVNAVTMGFGKLASLGKLGTLLQSSAVARSAAAAVIGNIAGYSASKIAGLDTTFSWKSIAASAVTGAVSGAMGKALKLDHIADGQISTASIGKQFAVNLVGGVVSANARKAFGLQDKVDYGMIALDAFGNALGTSLGNAAVTGFKWGRAEKAAEKVGISSDWVQRQRDAGSTPDMVRNRISSVAATSAWAQQYSFLADGLAGPPMLLASTFAVALPADPANQIMRLMTAQYLADNPQVQFALETQRLARESGVLNGNYVLFADRATLNVDLVNDPNALAARLDQGIKNHVFGDADKALLQLVADPNVNLTQDQLANAVTAFHRRMASVGLLENDPALAGVDISQRVAMLAGTDDGLRVRLVDRANTLLNTSARELVLRQAMYNDLNAAADNDTHHVAYFDNEGQIRSIDFDRADNASGLANAIGVSTNEAFAKTNWSVYEAAIYAAANTGISRVNFAGAFRPSFGTFQSYFREGLANPNHTDAQRREAMVATMNRSDMGDLVTRNGLDRRWWNGTGRPPWSSMHTTGAALDISELNQFRTNVNAESFDRTNRSIYNEFTHALTEYDAGRTINYILGPTELFNFRGSGSWEARGRSNSGVAHYNHLHFGWVP